ncbi:hypothetical protein KUF71_000874 [Frankliniella fusca]|uniref:Uncharacterized protein n=1 Tax=Frankliniella fusca TaxID=407009 RepID=A0AAE1HBF8_9NEOP|nr:hypothetical protein KUF71_000874 [Frankliniella fusca]
MSSVCSSSGAPSSLLHEESSSWWDDVFEAKDLLSDMQGQSRAIGAKKWQLSQQDILLRFCGTRVEECTTHLEPRLPARFGCVALARSVLSNKRSSPSDQKIAAAKLNLNSGREHVNYSGKRRRARQLKKACHEDCNRCEDPRLQLAERQEIFNTFWSLSDHERQWLFIYGLVKTTAPRQKFSVGGGKQATRHYSFNLAGTRRRVCKTMFKNTLCICDSWIDSALSHFSKDGFKPDMRGKVRNVRRGKGSIVNIETG